MQHTVSSARALVFAAILISLAALVRTQPSPREQVGPLPGGGFLLNTGWRVAPAGKQVPLDTLPMATALSPDGKYLLVLNGGYRPPCISVIETASASVVSRVAAPDAWLGLTFSPGGDRVYVGGGSKGAVFEFSFANGTLTATRTFPVYPEGKLADQDFIGDVALRSRRPPALRRAVVPRFGGGDQSAIRHDHRPLQDRPAALSHPLPSRRQVLLRHPLGRWHRGPLRHRRRQPAGAGADRRASHRHGVAQGRARGCRRPASPTASRGCSWPRPIPTTCMRSPSATAKELNVIESINVSMTPRQPLGMTPSALALSPDGKRLYVACSDANAAAVVDVSEARSRVEGFIPTGWYPTAVRVLPSGTLVVLNGKGTALLCESQRTRPRSPRGTGACRARPWYEYVGAMQTGTASWIDPFTGEATGRLDREAIANSAYTRRQAGRARSAAAHPARHLHRAREPHLRPGAGRHEGGQRRPLAGAVRRKGHAQPAQAGARVRAAGQLLRERRRERRRPQLVHRGHRPGLRAEDVAQQVRQPAQVLRFRRAGPGLAAAGRLPVDQRGLPRASPCATSATW